MKMDLKKWNVYAVWALSALLCVPLNACDNDDDEQEMMQGVPGGDGGDGGDSGAGDGRDENGEPDLAGHEAVDLGLPSGTLWATMNVGATSVNDYGSFFSWGETSYKSVYDITTYAHCRKSYTTLTKYCLDMNYGSVDNKTVLDMEDDAARAVWGGSWRMPTQAEMQELLDECTCVWTIRERLSGIIFTSANGNSVFFPASGYCYGGDGEERDLKGYYWTSSLSGSFSGNANTLVFDSGDSYRGSANCSVIDRFVGAAVRPVVGR